MLIPQVFMNKVNIDPETGCWIWQASTQRQGYGRIRYRGREYRAHRFAYTVVYGDPGEDLVLGHACHDWSFAAGECLGGDLCQHRLCVNPDHLVPMTQQENLSVRLKSHCPQGHPYPAQGRKRCAECRKKERVEVVACPVCGKAYQKRNLRRHTLSH